MTEPTPIYTCVNDFNSHAHVERDGLENGTEFDTKDFNSHAHVERDAMLEYLFNTLLNFNSHAHVERDFIIMLILWHYNISTHTLTWSVTYY